MTLIAAVFLAISVLFQFALPVSKEPPAGNRLVEQLTQDTKQQQVTVKDSSSVELNHDGVVISTAFSDDWSISTNGRQKVLSHKDREAVCQSVVIPASEYDGMVQAAGSLEEGLRAMMSEGMAGAPVTIARLFHEAGPPVRTGVRLEASLSFGGMTRRQVVMTVWTVDDKSAANLNCVRMGGDPSDTAMLQAMIKAYKFKKASG